MSSPSVIPETPQIFGRLRSLFSRRLFVSDEPSQPSASVEVEPAVDDDSLNSTDDMSSLLLTQQPTDETVAHNSGQAISTVITNRECAPATVAFTAEEKVQLFRGPREPLSAFFHHPLRWQNRTCISAEQVYQYAKLVHHKAPVTAQREMLRCKSSHACKQLAYKIVRTSNASWDGMKFELMEEICTAKFRQCKKFKETLRKSRKSYLLHNTETDSVWGCGPDLQGLNKMGHILMSIRQRDIDYAQDFPPLPETSVVKAAPQVATKPVVSAAPAMTSPRKVVVIGNSNARGLSHRLSNNGIAGTGYVYPGQTASQIVHRVKSMNIQGQSPDAILVHVGDIEVRDSSDSVSTTTKSIKTLVDSIRTESAGTSIIVSGLPHAPGQSRLNHRIAYVNSANSQLCKSMDNVYYVSNKTASRTRDNLHLTAEAKDLLCNNITYLLKQSI